MKLTKRDKNTLTVVFGFYILVFFILSFYSITYFYPNIIEIENKKIELKELYESKVQIENKGITFSEFVVLNKENENVYLKNIISNIEESFYDNNFINTGDGKFENFINRKKLDIDSGENQNKLLIQNEKIIKILPSYSEKDNGKNENTLTNFKFINYIESILATFNLESTDKIGIENIELLGEYKQLSGKNNNLEVNLFAFPLKFTIDGTKEGIINFIHFAQNVGNIIISEENDFTIYNDEFLKTRYGYITLKGDPNYRNSDYNIYENQILNIDYIKFGEYINTYGPLREKLEFSDYVKSTQGNDKYSVDVKLYFYVKGLQQHELTEYIKIIIEKYFLLTKAVENKIKNVNTSKYDILKFKQVNVYLKEINKEILNLKKELQKKVNLEQLYNKVDKYSTSFRQIEKLIK